MTHAVPHHVLSVLVLAQFAKQFSSFEYFWLVLLGVVSGVFATPNLFKGLIAFAIGMLLATIGFDPALGTPRFTFGNTNLLGGFDFIVGLIALFGVGEVLLKIYGHHGGQKVPPLRDLGRGHSVAREFFVEAWLLSMREKWRLIRSSLLGTFIGFLPGAGSDLAAWVSSNFARMTGANREQVALEGTASNNAAIAGTWIPALALGIPGDTLTAIVLGMFLDGTSMTVMTVPIAVPLIVQAGFDPLWFGIYLVIMIEMSALTPPVGLNLFVLQGLTGASMGRTVQAALPFFLLLCLGTVIIAVFPQIVLWLPGTL